MKNNPFNLIFGQPVLSGVKWPIKRTPDDILINISIGSKVNNVFIPSDLTGCQIDIPITDADGNVKFLFTSGGMAPNITIIDGPGHKPNARILQKNAAFVAVFTANGNFPVSFIFTDATGIVTTYWIGTAQIG